MKKAVIIGGSSGIGKALAKELLSSNYSVLIAARDASRLNSAKDELTSEFSGEVSVFSCDVIDESSLTELSKFVNNWSSGQIDLLVYSVGDIACDRWDKIPIHDQKRVMEVNYWGAVSCTKELFPYLENAKGSLLFVSSVAGFMGLYGYAGYSPSKHALTGWVECLRMEAAEKNVSVHIAFPGDTTTPFLIKEHKISLPETKAINAGVKEKSPEHVAKKIFKGLRRGRFNIYSDRDSPLIRILKALTPRIFLRMLDKMSKKK